MLRPHRVVFLWLAGLLGAASPVCAQISPGELSAAHASLEGIGKCTSCHEVGRAVSDARCLACHAEIRSRMEGRRGLHALYGNRHCVECHKEHHGRQFDIVHFDQKSFSHTQTGYALEGAHGRLECRKCHNSDHVRDSEVLSRVAGATTFLGLKRECASCHRDPHGGQLSAACTDCHGMESWKPAPGFSHDRARFKLAGGHAGVKCERCHPRKADGALPFRGIAFASCKDCHSDPHQGRFKQSCEQCHSVQGWKEGAGKQFSHAQTRFPLTGKHSQAACARCHPAKQFHVEHFQRCSDCHKDPHRGQFAASAGGGACETCHTVNGFAPSTYSAARHQSGRFMLDGAHGAVPCTGCHRAEAGAGTVVRYRWEKPTDCRSCHDDVHKGSFNGVMRSGCATCHTAAAWSRVAFAHDSTRFPLTGAHAALACSRCHLVDGLRAPVEKVRQTATAGPRRALRWEGAIACTLCHTDPHHGQFQNQNGRQCEGCHTTRRWQELLFSHDSTKFRLTGAHVQVPCERCHRADPGTTGGKRYAGTPTTCAACHSEVAR